MKSTKLTLRMCVVCKQMKEKSQLIRIAKNNNGEISLDPTGKAAGRGAFVCETGDCIQKCKKRRQLNRAFKCEVGEEVYDKLLDISINVIATGKEKLEF